VFVLYCASSPMPQKRPKCLQACVLNSKCSVALSAQILACRMQITASSHVLAAAAEQAHTRDLSCQCASLEASGHNASTAGALWCSCAALVRRSCTCTKMRTIESKSPGAAVPQGRLPRGPVAGAKSTTLQTTWPSSFLSVNSRSIQSKRFFATFICSSLGPTCCLYEDSQ